MKSCGLCSEVLTDGALCPSCTVEFHFHCAGINENTYRKLRGEKKASWRCPKCKISPITMQSSITPTVLGTDSSLPSSSLESHELIIKEIRLLSAKLAPLDSLTKEFKELKAEVSDLKKVNSEAKCTLKQLSEKINSFEHRINQLEKIKSNIINLEAKIDQITAENNIRDQWARMNNVEIKGIPISKSENLLDIVCSISTKINYPISKQQINYVARIPSKDPNKTKSIVVCFNNRYVKEDFVAAARGTSNDRIGPLTCAFLGIPGGQRVFINDHLTPLNKVLLSKVKNVAKDRNFQFIWVKHCKIMARKDSNSPVLTIKSEKDISRIV